MVAPLLSVRRVHKRFGGTYASRDVSLDLFPGEVLALAGGQWRRQVDAH